MKAHMTTLALVLCTTLLTPQYATAQTPGSRPRRVAEIEGPGFIASGPGVLMPALGPENARAYTVESSRIESIVPRDGLQFYLELRHGALNQIAQAASAFAPVTNLLVSGRGHVEAGDLARFVMNNLSALSNARLAIVGYGAYGTAIIIEAADPSDAERLGGGIAQLLGARRFASSTANGVTGSSEMSINLHGNVVLAGSQGVIARLVESNGSQTISEDQELMQARARFSGDPFFAYIEVGFPPVGFPDTGDASQMAAYNAGLLAALNNMPYAVVMGGSMQGDTASLRALALFSSKQRDSLFSSMLASARTGQPLAASFAAPDTELFIDVMLDWDKLYEAIQSLFGMFAGAALARENGAQGAEAGPLQASDVMAMAEASLGFSIKKDLIPSLGNEVAITLSGFAGLLGSVPLRAGAYSQPRSTSQSSALDGQRTSSISKAQPPRFALMIAVRDQVKFENILSQLFNKAGVQSARPFARSIYRGATIRYRKDMAYTVFGGFFILGGGLSEIQRAIDARATGVSLASTAEFRAALGTPRPAMLQGYISSGVSGKIYELISAEMAKTNPAFASLRAGSTRLRSPLGMIMTPDPEGLLVEMHIPTHLIFVGIASMVNNKEMSYGLGVRSSQASGDAGIDSRPDLSSGPRNTGRRRTPKLTSDDIVRARKP